MNPNNTLRIEPLGFPWKTTDPFLFCVYHQDFFPQGNEELEPAASLAGRQIGQDFVIKDGWRMYHGKRIPGFPSHPHRGFETVTVVQQGVVDHADSRGASGRYGNGDVQWMTAGSGIQHSEMFPMLNQRKNNTLELFQIWLNLPKHKKMVEPHFKMIWRNSIPVHRMLDNDGNEIELHQYAGSFNGTTSPETAPDSWAKDPKNEVAIWHIRFGAGSRWKLPASRKGINRCLYFFQGDKLELMGTEVQSEFMIELDGSEEVELANGDQDSKLLILQGKPIGEPVAQYGPFVMNTSDEIQQAFKDYQRTQFGGWPWDKSDPIHGRERGRFALHNDGNLEEPD